MEIVDKKLEPKLGFIARHRKRLNDIAREIDSIYGNEYDGYTFTDLWPLELIELFVIFMHEYRTGKWKLFTRKSLYLFLIMMSYIVVPFFIIVMLIIAVLYLVITFA